MTRLTFREIIVLGTVGFATLFSSGQASADETRPIHDMNVTNQSVVASKDPNVAFDAKDYAGYDEDGNDVLDVYPFVATTLDERKYGSSQYPCTAAHPPVLLFPQTPYTVEMVARWSKTLDAHEISEDSFDPGLSDSGMANVPDVLNPESKKTIVRRAYCNDLGYAEFKDLPAGTYIAVAIMWWYDRVAPYLNERAESTEVYGYFGDDLGADIHHYVTRGQDEHYSEGYAVAAFDLDVDSPSQRTDPEHVFAIAHFKTNFTRQVRTPETER